METPQTGPKPKPKPSRTEAKRGPMLDSSFYLSIRAAIEELSGVRGLVGGKPIGPDLILEIEDRLKQAFDAERESLEREGESVAVPQRSPGPRPMRQTEVAPGLTIYRPDPSVAVPHRSSGPSIGPTSPGCDCCVEEGIRPAEPVVAHAQSGWDKLPVGLCQRHLELEDGNRSLVAGIDGRWQASASMASGISVRDLSDPHNDPTWVLRSGKSRVRAFRLARSVWPEVSAAKTGSAAATILGEAGVDLHGYCAVD